jgi:hypothetical protein
VPDTLQVSISPFVPTTFTEHLNVLHGYLGLELAKGRLTGEQTQAISKQLINIEAAHTKEMHGEGR